MRLDGDPRAMRGVRRDARPGLVVVLESSLAELAIADVTHRRDGIDPLTVESALNTVEFHLRENNTGSFPRGIVFMLRSLRAWLHGRDPLTPLAFAAPLAAVKARVAAGERYFEALLRHHFIDNPHRTVITLKPDRDQAEREAAEEQARLDAARAAMTDSDVRATMEAAATLKHQQEQPDPPEALATIPTLTLADLPRENKLIPLSVTTLADTRVLYHDLFTNGIVYLDLGFDLHTLPGDLLPYVWLFGRALIETGVGNEDFVRLSQRIGRATGGIRPQRWSATIVGQPDSNRVAQLARQGAARADRRDAGDFARHSRPGAARQPRALRPAGAGGEGGARIPHRAGRFVLCGYPPARQFP